ncbi:RNA helicase [Psidium guajava]|nr:RNA helicase [Psidium guajava]
MRARLASVVLATPFLSLLSFSCFLRLTVTPFFKQEKRKENKTPLSPFSSVSLYPSSSSMPSIAISDSIQSSESSKSKSKEKKMKAKVQLETEGFESPASEKKHNKEKKSSKSAESKQSKLLEHQEVAKKEKKRKALELGEDDDEDKSETSSELVDPENLKANKEREKKKKARLSDGDDEVVQEENPNAVSNFRISDSLRLKLKDNGIASLFPIQAMTFDIVLDGSDLVGRARTGQGKTLAFVLPILESLTNGPAKTSRKTGYSRPPSVLVLLPTRELAKQVFSDFEVYGGAVGLTSCCLYGGAPYQAQESKLRRGVDIVIGTPGRVKDHIERENIDLSSLTFRVLDEADEMLRMGFVEDVELILGKVKDSSKVQTLLFSATLPDWVKGISSRFLKQNKRTVDLVGNEKMKASTNVRHIVIPCTSAARSQLIPDIIRCYGSGGRTIIFTETKESASQLSGLLTGARPLHGDIQQAQREVNDECTESLYVLFHCEPPRDVEAYIHRSGRTGRAGNTGVAVMLYDPRRANVSRIEKQSGVKFEHIAAPQPSDVAQAAGVEAAESITQISDSVIPAFKSAAEQLLDTSGMSAVELLAKALAKASGYSEIKSRSLLSSLENHVTLLLETGRPIYTPSYAFGVLRRFLPEEKVESVKGLALTADGNGVVFDVAAEDLDTFLAGQENAANVSLVVVKTLPLLQERDQPRGGRFGSGGGRGMAGFPVALVAEEVAATIEDDKVIRSQFLGVGPSGKMKGIKLGRCRNFG